MADQYEQFDTRPKAVKNWLDNLPIAHIGETSRQLYTAMREVNQREETPVKQHFRFLEGVAEPLNMILPELHKHYIGKPLPLSKKRRKVADLYTQLLHQAVTGYQQVIARAIELNRFGWKKVVTTSVHRIFHYSSLMLLNQRLLYQPHSKGLWQQLYWLYQMVESYKLLNTNVDCVQCPTRKSTITAEFKKLLLHSILAPNLFRPSELDEVLGYMDLWLDQITLSHKISSDRDQVYAFTLDTDIQPGLIASNINASENPAIDVRYVNLAPLLAFINRALNQADTGVEMVKLTRKQLISRRCLLLLLNNWGRPSSRDGERRLIQGQAEVAFGISAIHYVISEGQQAPKAEPEPEPIQIANIAEEIIIEVPDPIFTTRNSSSKSDNSLASLGFTTDRDTPIDVWESAYFEPDPAPASWTESIRMKVYSYLNARVINISKGGFCIALPQNGVEHIQTNDLVAIRGKRGEWQLGEIRWLLCPRNAPIRAGIKKLSQTLRPAQLHIHTKLDQPQPIKCLIGEDETGNILFLPNLPFALGERNMQLEVKGQNRRFRLLEQVSATPTGSAYYFEWRQKPTTTDTDSADSSGYESIWAKL